MLSSLSLLFYIMRLFPPLASFQNFFYDRWFSNLRIIWLDVVFFICLVVGSVWTFWFWVCSFHQIRKKISYYFFKYHWNFLYGLQLHVYQVTWIFSRAHLRSAHFSSIFICIFQFLITLIDMILGLLTFSSLVSHLLIILSPVYFYIRHCSF